MSPFNNRKQRDSADPLTLNTEDVVPATSSRSQPVAAAAPESLNISCEVTFRHGSAIRHFVGEYGRD